MNPLMRDCPACGRYLRMTRHHIKPVRWFGNGKKNNEIFRLCRECHDELEHKYIPHELMPVEFYHAIVQVFLYIKRKERR